MFVSLRTYLERPLETILLPSEPQTWLTGSEVEPAALDMNDDAVDEQEEQATWPERSDVRNAGVELVQQETVVLVVDLVESVRLMREHEAYTIRRLTDFVRIATTEILPRHRGVLVKSLGDGLMARFEAVPDAVDAAAEMHRTLAAQNASIPEHQHFHLRAGVNAGLAWSDGTDIYGTGVNLASRLATLAALVRRSPARQRMSSLRRPWPLWRNAARSSAAPPHATSLPTVWTLRAKISGIAFSSTLRSRFARIASGRQVDIQASLGGATTERPWNPRSP
jgi:class 3 adenylate cyclase